MNDAHKITFQPDDIKGSLIAGDSLLDVARRSGVNIASSCGGRGICKSCLVHFQDGSAPIATKDDVALFSQRKIDQGWRRACCSMPEKDAIVYVPRGARIENARVYIDGAEAWTSPDSCIEAYRVVLESQDNIGEQLIAAVKSVYDRALKPISTDILESAHDIITQARGKFLIVSRFGEVISILPSISKVFGVAVDLGTTNIGVYLVDLRSGTTCASVGIENPQLTYGGDLVARVTEAKRNADALQKMTDLTQVGINGAIKSLCERQKIDRRSINDVVIAGNTAMHHIFLGLSVDGLGLAPFKPTIEGPIDVKAHVAGLDIAPGAYVHLLPNIAGFVGGDHTAMLLGLWADKEGRTTVMLDIGTNTEISLIHQKNLTCVSCPSGPALEGGNIEYGMRAATGAIERVKIQDGKLVIETIGNGGAAGICGSGVIDVLAQFYLSGDLNSKGLVLQDGKYFRDINGMKCLLLSDEEDGVFFSQHDVRSVQLAKGAIRAGIEVLLTEKGLHHDDIDMLVIAGAFGAYINVENAVTIGMLPDIPLTKIEQVGNAAGAGVKLALLSYPLRLHAHKLARDSHYMELAGKQEFMTAFMHNINFPKDSLENKTNVTTA